MEKIRSRTAHPISVHMARRRRGRKNSKKQIGRVRDIRAVQRELRATHRQEEIVEQGGYIER